MNHQTNTPPRTQPNTQPNLRPNLQANGQGFTLIELMLATTFVSFLLLAIAMTVMQMGTTYNRGMTIKEVNQSARDAAEDIRRTVSSSEVFTINDDGSETDSYVLVKQAGKTVGGRLCTGTFSYVWNSAYAIERDPADAATITKDGKTAPVRLFKVPDSTKLYCMRSASGAELSLKNIAAGDVGVGVDLLKTGDSTLNIQDFRVASTATAQDLATNQRLYTVSFRLGTGSVAAMDANQEKCLEPGQANANWTYCNVQEFAIVVRAGNVVGE